MVTMYFIYLYTYSNSVQMIPHKLPLFKDKAQCEVVVDEIKEAAPSGKFFCLPIQVEKSE
jgi:hypothetical protein